MSAQSGREKDAVPSELEAWMSDEERKIRVRLSEVDLVVRADFDESEVHRIQGFYGIAARRHRRAGGMIRDFIDRYPALTMTALVGHAALAYDHGRYWETFWAELDLPRTLAFENSLRECVEPNIDRFGLDAFPELRGRYVQMLGVHAGVPIHCMGALIEVADEYLHRGRHASGAGLVDWIMRSEKNPQLMRLAKPVRNFVAYGGSFAIDVLDYLVKSVDRLLDDQKPGDLGLDSPSIPKILRDGVEVALEAHVVGRAGPAHGTSAIRGRRRSPAIVYAPLDDQIVVELPPTEFGDGEKWRVSVDGDTTVVTPLGAWGLDWHEWAPTRLPVLKPARELVIECNSTESSWKIPLVHAKDPVLLFDGDGRWLRNQAALPKGELLVVYPEHARLVDEIAGVELEPYAYLGTPGVWRGWQAAAVDLSGAMSLRVVTEARKGVLRGVRVVEVPRLEFGTEIVGLTTSSGIAVYSERPRLRLPGRRDGDDSLWRVVVRRSDDGSTVVDSTYASGAEPRTVDALAEVTGDLTGLFHVVVTGSAGSSLHFTVFILEGVEIVSDRWVRVPASGGGLQSMTAQVHSRSSIRPALRFIDFARDEIKHYVEFVTDGVTKSLIFTPPHVRIHVGAVGQAIRWRTSVPVLFHADLDDQSVLVLNVPGCVALRLDLIDKAGASIKWNCPRKTVDGHFEADLRVFTNSARVAGDCVLAAVAVAEDQRIARFTVAQIRPIGSCQEVRVEDGQLVFDGLRIVDDLAAYIWWSTAPWAGAREVAVTDTRIPLPREFSGAGNLYVQLHISDPWVLDEPPEWPDGPVFEVEQPGYRRDRNKNRERLSKYLVQGGRPPTSVQIMPEIWTVLARAERPFGCPSRSDAS